MLFLLTAALIKPLFQAGYLNSWGSIEGARIADIRYLIDHWPHPGWQPLWYAGTRFDFLYPPLHRYAAALISMLGHVPPVKAHHLLNAFFYCVGIAAVYMFVRTCAKSRGMAWLAAVATLLMSPAYLFLEPSRRDAWMLLPARLAVMVKYGDAPHMMALAMLPLALACAWRALESFRVEWIAIASVVSALVVSTDPTGGTALLPFYLIAVWSVWITHQDKRIVWTAAQILLFTTGLVSFWMTPSYLATWARDITYFSIHGTTWSIWFMTAAIVSYALLSDRFALGRKERAWAVFTTGCVIVFSLNVLANFYFKFRIAGQPNRLVPELDLAIILFAAAVLRSMWNRPGTGLRWLSCVVVGLSFCTTAGYLEHAWQMFPAWPDYHNRIEYKISEWFHKNMPDARVMPTGSVRIWLGAWHDVAQLSGGSDEAILSRALDGARWEIRLGPETAPSVLWLQSLGADAVYVSDARSQEVFKEITNPKKYDDVLPLIFDDQQGNRVFRVPRRYAPRVRVVERDHLNWLKAPRGNSDIEYLQAYVNVIEKGPDAPATLVRKGSDEMTIRAAIGAGQSVVVQESFDPAWRAYADGKPVPIRPDIMGFIVLDPSPGTGEIRLKFETPYGQWAGRAVSLLSMLALAGLVIHARRGRASA